MQKKIRIFLASSEELKTDREKIELFINRQNKKLADKNIFIHLDIWEDINEAIYNGRKQEEYNEIIRQSGLLVVLIFTKAGKYTKEEFETGYEQFKKTGNPKVYVYFKTPRIYSKGSKKEDAVSVFDFEERLKELEQFPGEFTDINHLINQLDNELDDITEKLIVNRGPVNKSPRLLTNIPKHDDEFIGREEDLENLKKELEASAKIVLMNGLGGIGKTTIAKKYVQENMNGYDHVAWIEVKTQDTGHEQNMSITEAFAYNEILTKSLELEFTNENNETRFKLIVQALSNLPGNNLLVIDNAREDLNSRDIKDILPRPPHWKILVTSRNNFTGFKTLEIQTLPKNKAKELFKAYYTKPVNEKDIEELLEEIGYHTLTIESLAKTLAYPGQKLTVKETFEKIKNRQLFSPELQRRIELNHSKEETEIYIHLIQTFNLLPLSEKEQWLMKQFCFLLPVAHDIERLETLLNVTEASKKVELHQTLNNLSKKGWLQLNEDGYSIHRVMQQMADYQLTPSLADIDTLIKKVINLLFTDASTNTTQLFYLVPFGEFILNKLSPQETDSFLVGRLQTSLGIVIKDLGDEAKAIQLQENALENFIRNFGNDHPDVDIIRSNLAVIYADTGKYQKAKDLLEIALANGIRNFGENHRSVSLRRSSLATVYSDMGEYSKAKDLLEIALKNDINTLGENHPSIAIRRSNLAMVYMNMEEYQKAKGLLETAIKIDIETLGEDHLDVATIQSNLASVHIALGEYVMAKQLLEKVYQTRLKLIGKDHAKTKLVAEKLENLKTHL